MRRAELLWLIALISIGSACKEKQPYPSGKPPSAPDAAPAAPERSTPMPLAVVITPEGSYLASARPDGSDLDVRRVSGAVYVRKDGRAVRLEVITKSEDRQKNAEESVFSSLVWRLGDETRTLFPDPGQARPDLKALARADPALASLYYHRERIRLFAAHGSTLSYLVHIEGFLGGAHPYDNNSLLVVDAETGGPAGSTASPADMDFAREATRTLPPDECVRRFAGVAPAEGLAGEPMFVAVLTHEFEFCRGRTRLVRVPAPARPTAIASPSDRTPTPSRASPSPVQLRNGVLENPSQGLHEPGVVDYRASPDGGVVVMLMGLGRSDQAPSVLADLENPKSRELRLWVRGKTTVPGRASRILTVQFLMDHPAPEAVLDAFSRL